MEAGKLDLKGKCGAEVHIGVGVGHRRWSRAYNGKPLQAGGRDSEEVGERLEIVDLVWDVRERQVPEVREYAGVPPQRYGVQLHDLEARSMSAEDGG